MIHSQLPAETRYAPVVHRLQATTTSGELRHRRGRSASPISSERLSSGLNAYLEEKRRPPVSKLASSVSGSSTGLLHSCYRGGSRACSCSVSFYRRGSELDLRIEPYISACEKKPRAARRAMSTSTWYGDTSTRSLVSDSTADYSFSNLSAWTDSTAATSLTSQNRGEYGGRSPSSSGSFSFREGAAATSSGPDGNYSRFEDPLSSDDASPVSALSASWQDESAATSFGSLMTTTSAPPRLLRDPRHNPTGPRKGPALGKTNGVGAASSYPANKRTNAIRAHAYEFDPEDGLVLDQISTSSDISSTQHHQNGQVLWCHPMPRCFPSFSNTLDLEEIPKELAATQLSQEAYARTMRHITRCTKVKQHCFWYNRWLHSAVFALIFLVLWMLGFAIWYSRRMEIQLGAGIFFVVAASTVFLMATLCQVVQKKLNAHAKRALTKVNESVAKQHLLVGLVQTSATHCYRLILYFMYMNTTECLKQLTEDLSRVVSINSKPISTKKQPRFGAQNISDSGSVIIEDSGMVSPSEGLSLKQRQDMASKLIHLHSSQYVASIITATKRLRPEDTRHCLHKICICQYLQKKIFRVKT